MFLFLSKLLPPFLFPPGLQIVLIAIALLLFRRRPRVAYALSIFALGSLYLLSTSFVSSKIMSTVESVYPVVEPSKAPSADAIVVLGDFVRAPTESLPEFGLIEESDRLRTGGLLFQAGKAPFVLLTGGQVSVFGDTTTPQAVLAKQVLAGWGVPPAAIETESKSENTYQNAVFSKPLLQKHGAHRILLVTSAFHMPRSSAIFRRAGFEVVPVPCDYRSGWFSPSFPLAWLPESKGMYTSTLALHEWMGMVVYRLRGWA